MSSIIAAGSTYFGLAGFPITIRRSKKTQGAEPSHPHDLTEVEHSHDFCELVIVKQGQAMQCLEGIDMPITAGDVFLLQGHQKHYFHSRQDLELINVMYNPKELGLPENELRRMPGYSAMFVLEPNYRNEHKFNSRLHIDQLALAHIDNITYEMEVECQQKIAGYEIFLRAKILELIAYLARTYTQGKSIESQALIRVGNVIGALENDYAKDWKLDELATIAHMSKSNLLTTFRKATHQSPIEYLIHLRIQRAMEMMRNMDVTITEIAFAVGFNDSNYFSRQFRKIAGISARQFKDQQQKFSAI